MTLLDDESMSADERRARDAVRALRPPVADPAFRARLRREFTSGTFSPRRRVGGPEWFRRPLVWGGALAAAAALAIVVGVGVGNRAPAWRVTSAVGQGMAMVGQRPVSLANLDELSSLLARGGRLRVPEDGTIEIVCAGNLGMRLTPGTDITLPVPPNRWFARGVVAQLQYGEASIRTGGAFHGARLEVDTPEARVVVTGTRLAVTRAESGTCVCVDEGVVRVGALGEDLREVPAGQLQFCFPAGKGASLQHEVMPEHLEQLERFGDAAAKLLGR